ncbi:MAG TPA: trypsin-like peptidase domain-containing protein [Solirubrobacteraceae bacterium]|nr:trypsin-like peptidase domain-containing protein [Solirubrobacteraceae bacterium]
MPALAGAVAGGVIAIVVASGSSTTKSVTTTVTAPSKQAALPASFNKPSGMTVNQIYKSASPGVVDIIVTSQSANPAAQLFGGGGGSQRSKGEGAGVVYNDKGYILTDEHVVSGAISVVVNFQDGKSYPAKVIGTDPSTDVGVIKVNAPASELHPIPLADSSQAQVGDPVVAIGSPFSLPETTTTGIVSQTGRSITAPNNYTIPNAIQTDAAINPGNSGGPLLDASGHVLGLNDQIETNNTTVSGQGSSSGVGFAIPSNTVKLIADKLIGGTKVRHAYVGVSLSSTSANGAQIAQITQNSPAVRAGLQPGDVVTAIDGSAITSTDQFIAKIDGYQPGQKVTLTVKRGGQTKQITVTLGTRPAQTPTAG